MKKRPDFGLRPMLKSSTLLLLLPLLLLLAVATTVEAQNNNLKRQIKNAAAASAGPAAASNATSARKSQPSNRLVVRAYSSAVRFYSGDGRLQFGLSPGAPAGSVFLCSFSRAGRRSAVNYSLTVLYPESATAASQLVSIQGRVVRIKRAVEQLVLACTASYYRDKTSSPVTAWNLLIIDQNAKLSGEGAWLKAAYLENRLQDSLLLASASDTPIKTENNSVACRVTVRPSLPQQARLSLSRNGEALDLLPQHLTFAWKSDGDQLTLSANVTYQPANATDAFECFAADPLRSEMARKSLTVLYKAGLTSVRLLNASDGRPVNGDSNVNQNDALTCQADVAMPAVTYSWRLMRSGRLTTVSGQNISLEGVNLYFKVCCRGKNKLNGRLFSKETCVSFHGNSTLHTVNAFDKAGRREVALTCGRRSTMGIVQVRYSSLTCNARLAEAEDGVVVDCPNAKCQSPTALAQVKRNCKKTDEGCTLDASWLMDPFIRTALKTTDLIPEECISFEDSMVRVEVSYFCTTPNSVEFEPTGAGKTGRITRYFVPRTGCYGMVARGASGGNHTTRYGANGAGSWRGGRGAEMRAKFRLQRGLLLSIVVGQHGGNSSEMSPTHVGSIEDNAGTGGGGGSFVYSGSTLYLAAGGGGGASYGQNGVDGQVGENGTDSSGPNSSQRGRGGSAGSAGWTNVDAASYHGGCGAGWLSGGSRRAGPEHGGAGHGGPLSGAGVPFLGGAAGGMNPGAVGGFGGGGGGSEDNGASGGGGGYSGGGAGTHDKQGGGGGGSYCNATLSASCSGVTGGNRGVDGLVEIFYLENRC